MKSLFKTILRPVSNWELHTKVWGIYSGNIPQTSVWGAFLTSFILIIALLATPALAAKSALDLGIAGVGARPMGMGKSFVSIADDANAVFQNPAGLAFIKSFAATSMSTRLLNRADYKLLGGIFPTKFGTVGLGYIGLNTPAGYKTTDRASLATATPISYGSSLMILSYGYDLNRRITGTAIGHMAVGGNLKFINNKFDGVEDASGGGLEADLGALVKPNKQLSLGVSLQNIWMGDTIRWNSGAKEDVPATIRIGGSFLAQKNLLVSVDTETPTTNTPILLHGGVEWTPVPILSIRVGADQDPTGPSSSVTNLTMGLGINVKGIRFDYAYRSDALQTDNSNHYFSISFAPEKPVVTEEAIANVKEEGSAFAGIASADKSVASRSISNSPVNSEEWNLAPENPEPEPTLRRVRSYDEIMAEARKAKKK